MIASHRTPATLLMTTGGLIFLTIMGLPFFWQGALPDAAQNAIIVARCLSSLLFVGGACVYARGIGYPAWLGLVAFTIIGFLVLIFLPDRSGHETDE